MANNTKAIKSRIKSIKNTSKVTKSMEKISAIKRMKYSNLAVQSKKYSFEIDNTSKIFSSKIKVDESSPDILKLNESEYHLLVVLSSDRGLCGAFNSNIISVTNNYISDKQKEAKSLGKELKFKFLSIGKRAAKVVKLNSNVELIGLYEKIYDAPTYEKAVEILTTITQGYINSEYRSVTLIYTAYQSTTSQNISIVKLLPFEVVSSDVFDITEKEENAEGSEKSSFEYDLEPDIDQIQEYILVKSLETKLYQAILDSCASEHTSRMIAMKNASDNASDLDYVLNLAYNKGRQASVTQEVSEIVSGMETLKDFN